MTRALNAHYLNSMGSTETGMFPAAAASWPLGRNPASLSKHEGPYGLLRLVDDDDNDVGIGVPGECIVRGQTLFSGYWRNEAADVEAFRGGRFHMGDVLVGTRMGPWISSNARAP